MSFKREEFYLLDWLDAKRSVAKFDLASSGIEPPNLDELGIETNINSLTKWSNSRLEDSLGHTYSIQPGEVLTCGGATLAIFLAIASTVKSGDKVLIPMPNYPPEYGVPRILGARLQEIKMNFTERFRLDGDAVAAAISRDTKLVVLTNSNNPTGLKISKKDLEKIIQAAGVCGSLVFVDETFREFADEPAPIARTLGDHVISAGSMTKFYGLGDLRVGWLFAGKRIMDKIRALNKWVSVEIARLSYMIAVEALEKKKLFDERTRKITKENIVLGREFIRKNSDFLDWVEPDGAPFGFPRVKIPISSTELCKRLIDEFGILVNPGEFFEYPGHLRLCLTRTPETTKAALDLFSNALSTITAHL